MGAIKFAPAKNTWHLRNLFLYLLTESYNQKELYLYQNIWFDVRKNKMHLWDDTKGYLQLPYKKYAYVKDRNGQHISLYGERLKRATSFDKDDPTLHESDIPPMTRFLVEGFLGIISWPLITKSADQTTLLLFLNLAPNFT